jgi:hypothetical protein
LMVKSHLLYPLSYPSLFAFDRNRTGDLRASPALSPS